jgi:plasmid stabilization system protein ParE
MVEVIIRPAASADIADIYAFSVVQFGLERADGVLGVIARGTVIGGTVIAG